MDLGVASKAVTDEKGQETVEVELEDAIDKDYDEALDSLLLKPEVIREVKRKKISKKKDLTVVYRADQQRPKWTTIIEASGHV